MPVFATLSGMKARNGEIMVTIRLPYWAYTGLKDVAKTEYRSCHAQTVKALLDYLAGKGVTEPAKSTADPFAVES